MTVVRPSETGSETRPEARAGRLGRHLRRNAVAYCALILAVGVSPLPAWAAGKVTSKDLAANAVTAPKIKANAVTRAKIKPGAVDVSKLDPAAVGFRSVTMRRVERADVADGATSTVSVGCEPGEVAIGGGAYVVPSGFVLVGSTAGDLQQSLPVVQFTAPFVGTGPVADATVDPVAWRTAIVNNTGSARSAFHYAVCAS
ncbi:hypothetical protein [Nocardioides sp.]|uniref:hypothetical protein n=1 Tax=Nocardioides sp. TaxID=35761 RepID=UPI003512B286